jgi:hypothetical protein
VAEINDKSLHAVFQKARMLGLFLMVPTAPSSAGLILLKGNPMLAFGNDVDVER